MFCKKCGNELKDGAKFCSKCHAPIKDTDSEKIEKTEQTNLDNNTEHSYRVRCCGGDPGRIRLIALPLFYLIIYFTGDTAEFTFKKDTLKIYSSEFNVEESYENIKNIRFQEGVPIRKNFPLSVSIIIAFLIVAIITNICESNFISILSIIVTLGLGIFLKFSNEKRTVITVEYENGKRLCIPLKKELDLKEQFLNDVEKNI